MWLLAGGGTLYFAFPALYASSFSGFYLPLMIVLWLLILRGMTLELRSHVDSRSGRRFWDAVFSAIERAAGDFLRSGAGQRDSRRALERRKAISFCRSGRTLRRGRTRAFWIGTRF